MITNLTRLARLVLAGVMLASLCAQSAYAFTCADIYTARNKVSTAVTKADVAQAIIALDPSGNVYRHQDIIDVLVRSTPDTEDAQAIAIRLLSGEAAESKCAPAGK